jgi:hypothetical protein
MGNAGEWVGSAAVGVSMEEAHDCYKGYESCY